jgi:hypothetical protein
MIPFRPDTVTFNLLSHSENLGLLLRFVASSHLYIIIVSTVVALAATQVNSMPSFRPVFRRR